MMKLFASILTIAFSGISLYLYQEKPLKQSLIDGEEIYTDFCLQCHMIDGQGVKGIFPPLADSDYLNDIPKSIHAVKYGLKGEITVNGQTYNSAMVSQGLDDEEIADVMNYILRNWENTTEEVITETQVATIKK